MIRGISSARRALRRGRAWPGATRHGVLRSLRRGAVAVAVASLVASVCAVVGVGVQLIAPAPAAAAAAVPAPAGSWPFSEGSGTTTADSSGNGHTGTLGTGVTWAAPEVGAHSIATNNTAAGAVTVTGPVVNTAASYTVSAWVYLNAIGGGNQTFVSINGLASPTGTTVSGFYLQFQGSSDQFLYTERASDSTGAGVTAVGGPANVAAGTWYHLVAVYGASQIYLYINGALAASAAFTTAWQATGNTMIGQGMYAGNAVDFVNGKIDDVALYSSALTAAQVAALNPPVIATGLTTSCEVSSGNASCWGDNSTGTLGDNSTVNSSVPVPVYTGGVLTGVTLTQISVGSSFACALSSAGSAYCWGDNSQGQLGNTTTTSSNVPVAVSGGLTFTQIQLGAQFACALTSAGAAYCWGNDSQDQLGNATLLTNKSAPTAVTGGLTFTQISTGTSFACALTTAGAAYCWGKDSAGQIGNAAAANPQTSPLAVTTSGVLSGVTLTQINAALSGNTACALSSAGAAYCWGAGASGQLGNGSTTAAQTTAVTVTATGVLSGVKLTQISGGQDQTCALGSTGLAYCWGGNGSGDLGINSTTQSLVPAAVSTSGVLSGKFLTQISANGNFITCALGSFGDDYCWGLNNRGQLGDPDTAANTTGYFPVPVAVSPSQAMTIAAGYKHTCMSYYGIGYCWGDNTYGELGNNSTVGSTAAAAVALGAMPTGTVLAQVTVGNGFSCALAATGSAYCWGLGTSGQLGNGASVQSNVPVLVSGGLTFTGISAGGASACGVTSAGAVYCWGLGTSGQLGNNLGTTSSSPVAVTTSGVLSGLTVTQVSVGGSAACALATTGAAFCWGLGASGQLGNGGTASSNAPVTVSSSSVAYSEIGAGGAFACALSSAGAEYCWGDDTYGELGNNTTTVTPQSTPVAVYTAGVLSGVTLTQLTAGFDQACALSGAGTAYCWGLGTSGQLGNNTVASSSAPATVYTVTGRFMVQVSAGQYHTCAFDNQNTVYCWGLNSSGQVGRADIGTNFDTPTTIQAAGPALVATGYTHSCMIRAGKAYCWGANTYGQLGDNSTVSSTVPVAVYTGGALSGVTLVQVTAGNGYTCALSTTGAAYCWGYNADGELGNNSTANSLVPVAVSTSGVLSGQVLTQVSTGQYTACGVSSAGGAYCWGQGTSGQLGNGGTASSSVPVAVSTGGTVMTTVDAGGLFACALSDVGAAYCWGANSAGQLGNSTTTPSSTPVLVNEPGANFVVLTVGFNHACAASATTSVIPYCWGDDTYGELGNGTTTATPQSTPVTFAAASALTAADVPGTVYAVNYDTGGQGVAYNSTVNGTANSYRSDGNDLELTGDTQNTTAPGGLYDLGWTNSGQWDNYTVYVATAGTYTVAFRMSSIQAQADALHINNASGTNLTGSVAVPNTGGFQTWTTVTASIALPAGKQTLTVKQDSGSWNLHFMTFTLSSAGSVTGGAAGTGVAYSTRSLAQITAGNQSTCALDNTGAAYCWGNNNDGQIGNNTTTNANAAAAVTATGVLSGKNLTEISSGQYDTCALDTTGAAYCWGTNANGQLGNPDTALNFSVAVAVLSLPTMISSGYEQACLLSNGKAFCWGDDSQGQLGNNSTTTPVSTPVAVNTSGVLSGLTLIQVVTAVWSTCALASTGAAYCWGADSADQLGDGGTAQKNVAVKVAGSGSGSLIFTQITVGTNFACGLNNAGAAYCWGNNTNGQQGNGNTTTPVAVPGLVSGSGSGSLIFTQISSGYGYTCALNTAGAAYCWGLNTAGQLGNGNTTQQLTPVAVSLGAMPAGTVLTQIATTGWTNSPTTYDSTCALSSAGAAYCWGDDTYGELGNNTTNSTPGTYAVPVAVSPGAIPAGTTLTQITVGDNFACALSGAASAVTPAVSVAYCWGLGTGDQLGNNGTTSSSVPVAVSAGSMPTGTTLFQISSGQLATCTQDTSGAFYCWGTNTQGELGNASTTSSKVPVIVQWIIPGAPTGVIATPGNTTATISWTAPASLGSGTLTGYTATATAASGTFTCTTAGALTCMITGLTDGAIYSVTVVTVTTDGISPPSSPAVNVEPTGLSLTVPTSLSWALAGTGVDQSAVDPNAGDQQFTVGDSLTAGWNIVVSATTFTNGTHTLPNTGTFNFTGSLTSPVSITAPTATCIATCTLPTNTTTYPVNIITAASPTAYQVYDTAASTGEGVMTLGGSTAASPIGWWVQVPAATYAGVYTSTVTLEMISGP